MPKELLSGLLRIEDKSACPHKVNKNQFPVIYPLGSISYSSGVCGFILNISFRNWYEQERPQSHAMETSFTPFLCWGNVFNQ